MDDKTMPTENSNLKLVTVIIPVYSLNLSETELLALRQCFKVLCNHNIVVIKPRSLDIAPLTDLVGGQPQFQVESFDDSYFAGREGYNRLMLSAELYDRFIDSRYIFVCQTDVYVFRDELEQWCNKGYDYIGAPWLPAVSDVSGWDLPRRIIYGLRRLAGRFKKSTNAINLKYRVGNGGCSLRHTRHLRDAAIQLAEAFQDAGAHSDKSENFEDVVWSVRVNELSPGTLNIAPCQEAVYFSVESHPTMAMRMTNGKLPMATHAFARRRNRGFWKQHINGLDESISS